MIQIQKHQKSASSFWACRSAILVLSCDAVVWSSRGVNLRGRNKKHKKLKCGDKRFLPDCNDVELILFVSSVQSVSIMISCCVGSGPRSVPCRGVRDKDMASSAANSAFTHHYKCSYFDHLITECQSPGFLQYMHVMTRKIWPRGQVSTYYHTQTDLQNR